MTFKFNNNNKVLRCKNKLFETFFIPNIKKDMEEEILGKIKVLWFKESIQNLFVWATKIRIIL